jgi:hypothetical protein
LCDIDILGAHAGVVTSTTFTGNNNIARGNLLSTPVGGKHQSISLTFPASIWPVVGAQGYGHGFIFGQVKQGAFFKQGVSNPRSDIAKCIFTARHEGGYCKQKNKTDHFHAEYFSFQRPQSAARRFRRVGCTALFGAAVNVCHHHAPDLTS